MTGPAFAALAAILFGLSSPIAKGLLAFMDPWMLAGILYFGSGIGMAVVYFYRRTAGAVPPQEIQQTDFPWLAGVTVFGGILGPVFLMYGLAQTPASTSSLLLNLEGVFTALLAWIAFREHYDRRIVSGMVAIVLGGAVLSWSRSLAWAANTGPIFVALACLSWAIDNNLTRRISLNDPVLLTTIKSLVAGTTNLVLALFLGATVPSAGYLALGGLVGFLCYGLSLVCFILALRNLGASRTGAYFSSAPFVGALLSIFFWHDPVTLQLLFASALMLMGLYLHLTEAHEHEHVHEELEHTHSHVHDEHHRHEYGPEDPPGEPHVHRHRHQALTHTHRHAPDMHHQHRHE